jgi:imidazolonepropionase-like amidohydrolase
MAESGIWISPTLQAWCRWPQVVELRRRRDASEATADDLAELQSLETRANGRLDVMRRMLDIVGKERIVPGTDSGVNDLAFGHLDYDLELLVEVGFTPAEALESATRVSAEAVGLQSKVGTLEVGRIADLVAFAGDPTKDISNLSKVVGVFQSGQRVL